MIRLTRQADYGIVILTHYAQSPAATTCNARELASDVHIPLPMVSKTLKALSRAGLLVSHRGAKGGYSLAREPEQLSVAEILESIEGPLALMECSAGPGHCGTESSCTVRAPWQRINRAVRGALEGMTLAELGQKDAACSTFGELNAKYPVSGGAGSYRRRSRGRREERLLT